VTRADGGPANSLEAADSPGVVVVVVVEETAVAGLDIERESLVELLKEKKSVSAQMQRRYKLQKRPGMFTWSGDSKAGWKYPLECRRTWKVCSRVTTA